MTENGVYYVRISRVAHLLIFFLAQRIVCTYHFQSVQFLVYCVN